MSQKPRAAASVVYAKWRLFWSWTSQGPLSAFTIPFVSRFASSASATPVLMAW